MDTYLVEDMSRKQLAVRGRSAHQCVSGTRDRMHIWGHENTYTTGYRYGFRDLERWIPATAQYLLTTQPETAALFEELATDLVTRVAPDGLTSARTGTLEKGYLDVVTDVIVSVRFDAVLARFRHDTALEVGWSRVVEHLCSGDFLQYPWLRTSLRGVLAMYEPWPTAGGAG